MQEFLHNLKAAHIAGIAKPISRAECIAGKIQQTDLLPTGTVAIVPFYAARQHECFLPCILLCELNAQGELLTQMHLSLPIIPYSVLEPAALCPISMGTAESFTEYMAINPPEWMLDEQIPTWQQQLAYAEQVVNAVNHSWGNDLAQQQFDVRADCLIFSLADLQIDTATDCQKLNLTIFKQPNKIKLIDAPRNSGQSTYAKQLIIDAWIQAALKQSDPPQYVWLEPNKPVRYASIFDCLGATTFTDYPEDVHARLIAEYDHYQQGLQVVRNWQDFSQRIYDKYQDKGGLETRLAQLQANLKEAKAQSRHLQVLDSIWQRQKELIVAWSKVFDFIPAMQKQRIQRLYNFCKQNFPQEDVAGFTQTQLDDLVNEKVHRAINSERMVGDALHMVENDQYQAQLVRDKCLQWCKEQNIVAESVEEIKLLIQNKLQPNLARTALLYWQQDFAAKQGYADFLHCDPQQIELLIVEHAEYISPMQAVQLLAKCKRAVVMGNYNPLCNPRFATQIDYELTKHFALVDNDADFEDLQFDGVLGSVGNMWSLIAKDRDADEFLVVNEDQSLEYEFIDVQTASSKYHGSLVNQGSINAVVDWLNKHAPERDNITIYTCFAGQAQLLHDALAATLFARVSIRLIQEPCFAKSPLSIFVPVYSGDDPAPYIFDRGTEMLDQLATNTQSRLVIIGDMRLFNAKLHSASGKFAQQLNVEKAL